MKKWVIAAMLVLFTLTPALARAQSDVTISNLQVDIMPEYDQPEVLILYHLFLSSDTALPAELTLRIPAAVGDPYNLAMRGTDGQLYNIPYERTTEGDWALVTFSAPSTEIRFEYYDPSLVKNGPARSYAYQWPGDYPVESLSILVQQPVDAEKMNITPSLGTGIPGQGNLMNYNAVVGSVAAGETFDVSLTYEKDSDRLSSSTMNVQPAGPISEQTPGRLTMNDLLPWGLGIIALALIAGGAWWYWQSGRAAPAPKTHQRHRAVREVEPEAEEPNNQIYCHRCGKRATPGDAFCRACGTKLRT